jgi:hypothetical protein
LNIKVGKPTESKNELIYIERVELSAEQSAVVSIEGFNNKNYSFATLQVHSFYYNATIYDGSKSYYGTSNGFILKPDSPPLLRVANKNHDTLHFMIALIAYAKAAPIPGACSMEVNSTKMNMLEAEERENFLYLTIPAASEPSVWCENSTQELVYETFYTYIDQLDFTVDSYFDALQQMLFTGMLSKYHAKNVSPSKTQLFEVIAGRGLVVNTVVKNKNGDMSFYVPFATYSCPPNTWLAHCSDISFLKRAVSVLLVIHSVVMMLNLMVPDFIESIMNGMLYGGFFTIVFVQSKNLPLQLFDYFIIILVVGLFFGALLGTVSLYIPIGRYLSKLTLCNLLVVFIVECFFDNVTTITLQFLLAFIFSIILSYSTITYAAFLGGLVLILNLSYLIKVGNLHRLIVNNFLAFTTIPSYASESFFDYIRPNYINYRVTLNTIDYVLIVSFIFSSIYLTIRKEHYFFENPVFASAESLFPQAAAVDTFNCENARRRRQNGMLGITQGMPNHHQHRIISRSRRLHRVRPEIVNERTPLISHWLASEEGDDDVFETPQSSRYLQLLTAGGGDLTINDEELNEIETMDV